MKRRLATMSYRRYLEGVGRMEVVKQTRDRGLVRAGGILYRPTQERLNEVKLKGL